MSLVQPLAELGHFSYFAFRAFIVALAAVRRPRDLLVQLHAVFIGALPLSVATGMALGAVIWMHMHGVLLRAGPGYTRLLPQFLALAVVLEFAPLAAGFIVAGRSGASLSAELGVMRVAEQIDALTVLGLPPMRFVVAPRVLACMIALPLLTILIASLAILSSYLAEAISGTMSWNEYWDASLSSLRLRDALRSVLKTVLFGFLTGVTGCYCGMHAPEGAEGVGQAATRGVVWSILLVVVSDVVLVRLIQWID